MTNIITTEPSAGCTFERPLAVVLSAVPERRALIARALAQHAAVSAVGMVSLAEAAAVARGVMLSLIVLDGASPAEAHEMLRALRGQAGAEHALVITCLSATFASSLSDLVLPGQVGPNQIAAKARQLLDARRTPARGQRLTGA